MKKTSIFQYNSYKTWLENIFLGAENRGLMSQICRKIDCQRSYLSRVLNTKLQLTPDFAFKISAALHLTSEEQEYFLVLVDFERCSDMDYRQYLSKKLQKIKSEQNEVKEKIQRPSPSQSMDDVLYFSAWYWSAIHIWCSTPGKHTAESIAKKFFLDLTTTQTCLDSLTKIGFLEKHGSGYKYLSGAMHVDRKSILAHWNHSNWRNKALQDAQATPESSLHFTNLQTMTRNDYNKIRHLILDLIEKSEKIARPSEPEELVAICLDAFIVR